MNTGSSNTWVGAHKAYHPSRTSQSTGNTVVRLAPMSSFDPRLTVWDQDVSYGSGRMSGEECMRSFSGYVNSVLQTVPDTDTVTLGPHLVIQSQSIGVATRSQGFEGIDGILGKA